MEWNGSTGLALGIVSTLTPWFFSVHAKLATIAEQTLQGSKKIDEISDAMQRSLEKIFGVEKKIVAHDAQLTNLCERLQNVEETIEE